MTPQQQLRNSAAVYFTDVQRFLALFAQGLAGQFVHLRVRDTTHGAVGRIPMADSILLPAAIADFAPQEHNLGAYRIAVLRQIGQLQERRFAFDRRAFFSRWHRPALLRRVFVTLEDTRVDAVVRRSYPGARSDLERVLGHALSRRPRLGDLRSLSALLEALMQYSLGASRQGLLAQHPTDVLADLIDAAASVQKQGATIEDSARTALYISTALDRYFRQPPNQGRLPPTPENPASPEALPAPLEHLEGELFGDDDFSLDPVSNPQVDFRAEMMAANSRRGMEGQILDPDQQPVAVRDLGNESTTEDRQAGVTAKALRPPIAAPRSFLYDEWDYHRRAYLAAWCRVYEHRLRGDDFAFIDAVRRRHSALANQVRRRFAGIKPRSLQRVHRTSDGDELELDGVIEAVIDRRTGHTTDSHLYLRRDRALRDVAAAFLVDMSASTDFAVPDPEAPSMVVASAAQPADSSPYLYGGRDVALETASAPKRRVIDVAKDALALMSDALQKLGDAYAIYGFSGDGRENVEFYVAKDFDDKVSARVWAALGAMQPRRSTRMGAAIRHAIMKLGREPASVKVLIIISDGYPEDRDYGADRNDREYGIQDTARALQEAKRAGIVDFCVTIDPAGHDYLRGMCPESRYLVIDEVMALPRELSKLYQALTAQR